MRDMVTPAIEDRRAIAPETELVKNAAKDARACATDEQCEASPSDNGTAGSLTRFDRKVAELRAFMESWRDLPPQRSPQWYADRTFSVGASELSTLQGMNPFGTIRKMIAQKTGLATIDDKRAMNWGNVMEHVCGAYMEIVFQCKIHDLGAIPTAGMRNQRSSPDGVAVIHCLGDLIVSFEFKAPWRRMPKGVVPPYYRSQVLACLCAIGPSDVGLFVDTVLRRSAECDWTFESRDYDTVYHAEVSMGDPLALTMLFFYKQPATPATTPADTMNVDPIAAPADTMNVDPISTTPATIVTHTVTPDKKDDKPDAPTQTTPAPAPIDLGTCDPDVLDKMLGDTAERRLYKVTYGEIYTNSGPQPDYAAEVARHPDCVGYLPVKIMQSHIVPVPKEPGFVLQFQPQIDRIISTIKTVVDAPEADKLATFERECAARGWHKGRTDTV